MTPLRLLSLTAVSLLAFAANSLLCRQALRHGDIDPMSFTTLRLLSGAAALLLLVHWRHRGPREGGDWLSAAALLGYAAAFSFAYLGLTAATGALLLFGSVQLTMIGYGLWRGERPGAWQWAGILAAVGGLVFMLLPGMGAPPPGAGLLMVGSGVAWGVYSLRGRGVADPLVATAGNFARAGWPSAALSLAGMALFGTPHASAAGLACAVASGALTSGVGYAVWYAAVRQLPATVAASVQLTVPVFAALGGAVLLGELPSLRLAAASAVVLAGVAAVLVFRRGRKP